MVEIPKTECIVQEQDLFSKALCQKDESRHVCNNKKIVSAPE
jgi:hypothetical protein